MTTEQLTTEQRLTNLELGLGRLESEVMSNSARLDRIEAQVARLGEGHIAIVEALAEIKVVLARMEERQSAFEARLSGLDNRLDRMEDRLDRMEDRLDRMDAKYDRLTIWVLTLMSGAVLSLGAIAVKAVFFP